MELISPAFPDGESIPSKYTCEGEELSIPLIFDDVPSEAVSLTLLMDDPDVPTSLRKDGMWDHWVVFNIDPKTRTIPEGSSSFGTYGKNTGGKNGYQGPCPPDREHRYFLKLYALDCRLSLHEGCSKHDVEMAMEGHILAEAILMGRYIKESVSSHKN